MAFRRICTILTSLSQLSPKFHHLQLELQRSPPGKLTIPSTANYVVQGSHKFREYGIGIVKAGEHREDVGTGIRVFLAQHGA